MSTPIIAAPSHGDPRKESVDKAIIDILQSTQWQEQQLDMSWKLMGSAPLGPAPGPADPQERPAEVIDPHNIKLPAGDSDDLRSEAGDIYNTYDNRIIKLNVTKAMLLFISG